MRFHIVTYSEEVGQRLINEGRSVLVHLDMQVITEKA
jgi:hypothetical protein